MKKITTIFTVLCAGVCLAAPPPKRATVLFDPKSDAEAFSFIPTPATCELHVVTSNLLTWVKYDGRQHGRARVYDTTVYLQDRVGQEPTRIVMFGGRRMPSVVGVSSNGSLLFDRGEEFIVSGDASTRSSSDAATFFQRDTRHTCPFDVQTVTSPSAFVRRLSEDKTPTFVLPVFRRGDRTAMRELKVKAVPSDTPFWDQMKSGALPTPNQLQQLWPIVEWDNTGFTVWSGMDWEQFKWDANNAPGTYFRKSNTTP